MTPAIAAKAYSAAADMARAGSPAEVAKTGAEFEFGAMLADQLAGLSTQGHTTEQTGMGALVGSADAVSLVTAISETELALETMISVRDKVIAAYEEIMRMPI